MRSIAVLGAGSWGTALAHLLTGNQFEVCLWGRNQEQVDEVNGLHTNQRYLPGICLSPGLKATTRLEEAVEGADMVFFVVPSQALRDLCQNVQPFLHGNRAILVHAVKGLEENSCLRMSEIILDVLGSDFAQRLAVLSGPSHAEEVAQGYPTTVVAAADNLEVAEQVQDCLNNQRFRVYTNSDLIGVELGGALKNVIALGTGLSDGLGYGDNAKAALLTRGLAEIVRLSTRLGANPLTFAGLAGLGDLVVTCTSQHSRNWKAGYRLGKGEAVEHILATMGMVVEGVKTTKTAHTLAQCLKVEMPITHQLYEVLFEGKDPRDAVNDLMGRVTTHEMEEIKLN